MDVVRKTTEEWIFSDTESERTWNIYVTNDGNMTLSVTMNGTTWAAFGRCMPAAYAKP